MASSLSSSAATSSMRDVVLTQGLHTVTCSSTLASSSGTTSRMLLTSVSNTCARNCATSTRFPRAVGYSHAGSIAVGDREHRRRH